jgi:hypothetical protein
LALSPPQWTFTTKLPLMLVAHKKGVCAPYLKWFCDTPLIISLYFEYNPRFNASVIDDITLPLLSVAPVSVSTPTVLSAAIVAGL